MITGKRFYILSKLRYRFIGGEESKTFQRNVLCGSLRIFFRNDLFKYLRYEKSMKTAVWTWSPGTIMKDFRSVTRKLHDWTRPIDDDNDDFFHDIGRRNLIKRVDERTRKGKQIKTKENKEYRKRILFFISCRRRRLPFLRRDQVNVVYPTTKAHSSPPSIHTTVHTSF